jgi:hypothetical protein
MTCPEPEPKDRPEALMQPRRRLWITAFVLFLVWVAALAAMAVASGRRPAQHHPKALAPR